jgi:hypothetical protein
MRSSLHLTTIPGPFSVVRLEATESIPSWALQGTLFSVTKSAEELSVVCLSRWVPAGFVSEDGFIGLKIEGPIPFSETGILASLASPLAEAQISLFALSTFDTDYILVRDVDYEQAVSVFRSVGHQVDTVGAGGDS